MIRKTRGHSDILYAEMIMMAVGALMVVSGDTVNGGALFLLGAAIHFGMGGFATGF